MYKLDRLGVFTVPVPVIEETPSLISGLFAEAGIIPLRAEQLYVNNVIEYVAYCPAFQPLTPGEQTPEYQVSAVDQDGVITYSVKKKVST